ncbi:MAG: hypothetical protein HY074_04430 [Deltaproteobacteria bacterium]|nr:hypothetical protein [Deltaproteobacteria bacterium]
MTRIAGILLIALAAVGCSTKGPLRPDPTAAEWERAVETPAEADVARKKPGPPPKLMSPADGDEITAHKLAYDQGVIVFSWSESAPDSVYTVEVAADANFTQIVLRKTVSQNALPYRMTTGGRLYWRVRTDAGMLSNVHWFAVDAR